MLALILSLVIVVVVVWILFVLGGSRTQTPRQQPARHNPTDRSTKGGIGPPELIAIDRLKKTSYIQKIDIPIDIPDHLKNDFRKLLADNAAKGANPKDIYLKVAQLLSPFYWTEFDRWAQDFRVAGEWPPLWDRVAEYYFLKDDAPVEELLTKMQKSQLLTLAAAHNIPLKKSASKKEMLDILNSVISDSSRESIFLFMFPDESSALHMIKSELLTHTISSESSVIVNAREWQKMGIKSVIINTTPDSCLWCRKHEGKKINITSFIAKKILPVHPGCRCSIMPADE